MSSRAIILRSADSFCFVCSDSTVRFWASVWKLLTS